MADKSKKPPQTEQNLPAIGPLRFTEEALAHFAEAAARQRRPIAVATHTEPDPYQGDQFLTITTLLFDDGTAWRNGTGEWRQVYELGDEEPK